MKIVLYTRDGKLVREGLTIPPFNEWPDVIVWGARTFKYNGEHMCDASHMEAEYRECFAFYIPGI